MNTKRFFKVFIIFTVLLCVVLTAVFVLRFLFADFGTGEKLSVLDDYEKGTRKNILLVGTDKGESRTDVIMIVSYSAEDENIHLVSVPRDTRMKYGNGYQKINSALALGGDELAIEKIRDAVGIPIHEYVKVDFEAVSEIVDALDGIEFDVPQDMKYSDPVQDLEIDLEEGMQTLDGDKALQLLRFRKYPMADLDRIKVQQDFIREAFSQKMKIKYVTKISDIYSVVEENVTSTLSPAEVIRLAVEVKFKKIETIETLELPTYLSGGYVIVDEEKLDDFIEEYFE